jgi:nucleotide-binding universal stress UspA family protein
MFRKILLAVDGSEPSLGAARVAARLAAESGASLRVLTVHAAPSGALGEPTYSASLTQAFEEADAVLAAAADAIIREGGPVPQLDRLLGHPAEGITDAAAAGGHDVIVMGNRGRGRIASVVLGSVSTSVATRSTIPVLIVPHLAG